MITILKEITAANKLEVGNRVLDLWKIQNDGLKVIETIVISGKEFSNFRSTLELDQEKIEHIKSLIVKYFPETYDRVDIFSSLPYPCSGVYDHIETGRSILQVKHAVERIQRSYWEDRAVAWRITNKVSDEESLPTVIIQPHQEGVFTITTRSPESGAPTTFANLSETIHNNVRIWSDTYIPFLAEIESSVSRPVKIHFHFNNNFIVDLVEDQPITAHGYLRYLTDMLDSNVIDSLTYLMRISSKDIMYLCANFTPTMLNQSTQVKGKTVNLGIGGGKLVFATSDPSLLNGAPYIFANQYIDPDYEPIIRDCAGMIGGGGGHFGIFARELDKPAVLLDIKFDEYQRQLVLSSGVTINEFSRTIVNGTQGVVFFNCNVDFNNINFIRGSNIMYLRLIIDLLFKYLDSNVFLKLKPNEQNHLSILLYRLRRVNLDYHLKIKELRI